MILTDGKVEFENIHPEDLWVYNKLQLSRVLGYKCGPVGLDVPNPDFYVVRPVVNFLGMSRNARIMWLNGSTDFIHPGEFWCELHKGEHLTVDYRNMQSSLVVRGFRDEENPLYKWDRWEKVDREVEFPDVLMELGQKYEWINCEFIDGKLIEVHIRQNPDFRHGNTIAVPIWKDDKTQHESIYADYDYIDDKDYYRNGFYIK